jgi:DNA-binding transcriptional regulator PaaX
MSTEHTITNLILEKLSQLGDITLNGLFPNTRAEGKIWRQLLGFSTGYVFSPRNFSAILSRLKQQGLVDKSGRHGKSLWFITKKGLDKLNNSKLFILPEKDNLSRLVIYDIPETEKRKREKLRAELIACDYRQLQRSVWLGHRPLPKKFIESLDDLKLKGKVQIFSVSKKGTLEETV